jgi:hypothetical protein
MGLFPVVGATILCRPDDIFHLFTSSDRPVNSSCPTAEDANHDSLPLDSNDELELRPLLVVPFHLDNAARKETHTL